MRGCKIVPAKLTGQRQLKKIMVDVFSLFMSILYSYKFEMKPQSLRLRNNLFVVVLLGIWDHSLFAGLPVSRTDLSVSIDILEGFYKSKILVWISANRKIID